MSFQQITRCLTIDGTHLQIETAAKIDTETGDEDVGTEDHTLTPPVATETTTEGVEGTDRREAIYAQGGVFVM